jgi:chromosome partitioning protein
MNQQTSSSPLVLVFGNEKGGSGKSTMAIHVAVTLMQEGHKVGTLDLDSRQATFTRFFQNRQQRVEDEGLDLVCPTHIPIHTSKARTVEERMREEQDALNAAMDQLKAAGCDVIIMDSPGSDTTLSRFGHRLANILVTPINDSFIDLDLIAKIDGPTLQIQKPSIYSDMVWEYRKERALAGNRNPIKWFIVRNRLSHINAQNKKNIEELLKQLERRFAFTFLNGFSERVIYRELFLKGLTLMDLAKIPGEKMSMSNLSARQEVRALISAIGLAEALSPENKNEQAVA